MTTDALATGVAQTLPQPPNNDLARSATSSSAKATKPRAAWIYEAVAAGRKYHFREQHRTRHNLINGAALVIIALLLAGTVALAGSMSGWLYVPLGGALFGLLYFALFVLVVHEASHGMLWLTSDKSTTRTLNRLSGTLVATLFGVHYKKHWEIGHLHHHVRPLDEADPQRFSIPIERPLLVKALKMLFVPGFLFYDRTIGRAKTRSGKSSSSLPTILAFVAIWAVLLTSAAVFSGAALALALFVGIHVLGVWNLVKGGLEHGGKIGKESDPFFRSRTTLFPGRRLLMPFNITLHFEHHMNFTVPWYDLGRYQRDLARIVPEVVWAEVINAHPTRQLTGAMGGLSDAARRATLP